MFILNCMLIFLPKFKYSQNRVFLFSYFLKFFDQIVSISYSLEFIKANKCMEKLSKAVVCHYK
jgi:hypothetical protein